MTRTWAISRPDAKRKGFSLLELLVVLVLMALATAVVMPSLQGTFARAVHADELSAIQRQLENLPVVVRRMDRTLVIKPDETLPELSETAWPSGWRVVARSELVIEPSGWCRGARIAIEADRFRLEGHLSSPDCQWREDE